MNLTVQVNLKKIPVQVKFMLIIVYEILCATQVISTRVAFLKVYQNVVKVLSNENNGSIFLMNN